MTNNKLTKTKLTKNKKIGIIGAVVLMTLAIFIGLQLNQPSYAFKLDVNPSIQIVSSRLNKVLEVNPLNEDAREMLKDFRIKDNDLEDTIEDIADLMVLTGHISGGKDNFVMITVDDKDADSKYVDKLNKAIAAYLENKQIEATIINQSISEEMGSKNTGRELVALKMNEIDDGLSLDDLGNMTIKELVEIAQARGISPELLFSNVMASKKDNSVVKGNEYIGEAKAKEIALGLVNGKIIEFELDDNDDDGDDNPEYEIEILLNDYKYEIELDAYTGKVLEFEKELLDDDDDNHRNSSSTNKPTPTVAATSPATKAARTRITMEEAKAIALAKSGGGKIIEAEKDDDGFEFEIINNGYEYKIDLNFHGDVKEFEKELSDDDDVKKTSSTNKPAPTVAETSAPTKAGPKRITLEEAKAIALSKSGGGKITEAEQDDDEFEFEITNNGYEYEIEIDLYGRVTEFEKELMDDD